MAPRTPHHPCGQNCTLYENHCCSHSDAADDHGSDSNDDVAEGYDDPGVEEDDHDTSD